MSPQALRRSKRNMLERLKIQTNGPTTTAPRTPPPQPNNNPPRQVHECACASPHPHTQWGIDASTGKDLTAALLSFSHPPCVVLRLPLCIRADAAAGQHTIRCDGGCVNLHGEDRRRRKSLLTTTASINPTQTPRPPIRGIDLRRGIERASGCPESAWTTSQWKPRRRQQQQQQP